MDVTSLLPGLAVLRSYERRWLRRDVVAGAAVAAFLVPQCMAYAEVAGLPAIVGLWAVVAPMTIYALVGSSRLLCVGPESATAIMAAAAVGPLAGGDPARFAALSAALALLVGVICVAGYAARTGFLANLLSKPLLVGYLAGVAAIMIMGQIERVTLVPVDGERFLDQAASAVSGSGGTHLPTLAVAAGVFALLAIAHRVAPTAPGSLLALVAATVVTAVARLDEHGIEVLGAVPAGLPGPAWPAVSLSDLSALAAPALGIAIIGYADVVLIGRAFGARRREPVDANQELLALGLANVGVGLTQGFPVSTSGSRTAVADSLGARTQLFALVTVAFVIAVLVVAGPLLAMFPTAALGGLVIYAAVRLVDVRELRRLAAFRIGELALALGTALAVAVVGVLPGIGLAVGLSVVQLFARLMRPHDAVLGRVPGLAGLHDVDDYPNAERPAGVLLYRYDAPLIFANAEDFKERALAALDGEPTAVEWFVLNAEANVEVDITGLDVLEELRAAVVDRGIEFGLARVKQDLMVELERVGLADRIGRDRIWPTLPSALDGITRRRTRPSPDERDPSSLEGD
jgi:sulfate permease, SulP family